MAFQVGTASGLEDMFTKILSFATTNATLVGLGQNWEAMRVRRDNLAELTTDLAQPGVSTSRSCLHTARHEARTANYTSPSAGTACFGLLGGVMGSSYLRYKLKQAREVKKVSIRAALDGTNAGRTIRNFRLQYSDDDSVWTTALTQTGVVAYSAGERKTFPVPVNPGAHLYWRIIIDSTSTAGYVSWASLLLLQADDTVANQFGSEAILRGPGLSNEDNIYVGIRSEYHTGSGWYNIFLNGYTGFDPNEDSWLMQPGCLPGFELAGSAFKANPIVPLWDNTMPYWLSVSGRSIRLGVKVSTSYEGMYLGLLLPYASPSQYPYPLVVGGSMTCIDSPGAGWRYDRSEYYHSLFNAPSSVNYTTAATQENESSSLYVRSPDGSWKVFINRPANSNYQPNDTHYMGVNSSGSSGTYRGVWPHVATGNTNYPYRETLGDPAYVFQPLIPVQRLPTPMSYGELEGVYSVSGYNAAAEDTCTFNGHTVVLMQNAFRTLVKEYWAISLE